MPTRKHKAISTIVSIAVGIFLAWALQAFVVKPYLIPSESMEKTLMPGQRILVDRLARSPEYGDIMVFSPPTAATSETGCSGTMQPGQPCNVPGNAPSEQPFVKRVAALGGDTVALKGGQLYRNGKPVQEPWAEPCPPGYSDCSYPQAVVVPKGYVYMIGDNRGYSYDSRFWGPIPEKWIIGKAKVTYWPPSRWGGA